MINKTLNNLFKGDKVIWMVFFFLCLISIVEVYSASSGLAYESGNYLAPIIKHIGTLLLGIAYMLVVANVKVQYFKIMTPFLLIISIVMLIWVLFAGEVNGASRWVGVGFLKFQPSEIAKGTIILATAQILSAMQTPDGADQKTMKYILIMCATMIPFILLENFSTAFLIGAVVFMMMIVGRVPMNQLGKLLGVIVVAATLFLLLVFAAGSVEKEPDPNTVTIENVEMKKEKSSVERIFHRFATWKNRLLDFFDSEEVPPEEVDLDKDMQKSHANIAIASSNILGKGPGHSVERDFLPQAFSDFIYAIIIEEMGIVGAFVVLLLYVILLFRTGRIAGRCEKNFPAFLAMGLALMLATQAMFNMCVAVGSAPVTGQPLPLISKGGTSTVINCVYIGVIICVSISASKKKVTEKDVENNVVVTKV